MTSFITPRKFSHQILVLTMGIFLLTATQAALAKNGKHSDDHGDMGSEKHKDKGGEMYSEKHKDKSGEMYSQNGDKRSDKHKDEGEAKYSEMHKDQGKKYVEKTKEDKHKTSGSSIGGNNPPAPGTGGTNRIHPILSPVPVASSSGAPAGVTPPVDTTSSGGPLGVTLPVNTIVRDHRHPPTGAVGPQSGVKPDGYTGFEDSTVGGHFLKGVGDFADGVTHGLLGGGPAPEDPTSTSTQY